MKGDEGVMNTVTLSECGRIPHDSTVNPESHTMRLMDAIGRVEPTWVEAVAVVQAVCAQLEAGQAPPDLGDIMLSANGTVSFPPSGAADTEVGIKAVGRLLTGILRQGDCPMPVWEASEGARRSPKTFGSVRAFGESLTCFPARQGPQELAAYFQSSRRLVKHPARPATALFGLHGLTARTLMVILAVTFGGVGAGMSAGALLVARTAPPSAGVAAVSMFGTGVVMPHLR